MKLNTFRWNAAWVIAASRRPVRPCPRTSLSTGASQVAGAQRKTRPQEPLRKKNNDPDRSGGMARLTQYRHSANRAFTHA
jgi:hypothetical protein